jgi:Na+/proline symporter/nitrogen-specific signal transduction histidine kinase
MTHELPVLFGAGVVYLVLLFLIAYATERGAIPERWVRHPSVYVLSLGVYATSWSYYGSVGFAAEQGYLFLTIYLGVTVAFLLSPLLLRPILKLTRDYQFSSLADLLAFRYRSQFAGALVTLFTLVGALPYIALQIRAVTESLSVLTDEAAPRVLALSFCLTLILFAMLFGARHISPRDKHRGLVVAIAFESLVKLVALLSVALFALFGVFEGPRGLQAWLAARPEALDALYRPVREGPWFTLLFLAFCASFLLPRQFHMAFTESLDPKALRTASWGFPLFLFLLNLAIPPVLWAGQHLGLALPADYYVLGITLEGAPGWLPVLTFIGGLSAASAMVIVTTLALSTMCLNHLLVPASFPDPKVDLYRWLLWGRRALIALIILAGYGFYALLEHNEGLVQLGLISFVAVAQFLPGVVGVLYWGRATGLGFITGLLAGISVWSFTLLVPLLDASGIIRSEFDLPALEARSGLGHWEFATFWSLALNAVLFVVVSLLTRQGEGERAAARACCNDVFPALTGVVTAGSPDQFREALAGMVGADTAHREVRQALEDLGMSPDETRPSELRRLRERIERNLSGLVGPQMAHMIVNLRLELDGRAKTALADSLRFVEEQLERSRSRLQGLTADLDALRRYHRQVLRDLPLGVCAVGADLRVTTWNPALERISGLGVRDALGCRLASLSPPWGELFAGFARSEDTHIPHMRLDLAGRARWFNLHKARVLEPAAEPGAEARPGLVMLVEDLTDLETLEAELAHSDRLASIGRLAAGVAHEIGNPATAVSSLAQVLRDESRDPETRRMAGQILAQVARIVDIVRSLMSFSRSGAVGQQFEPFPLAQVVDEALGLVRLAQKGKGVACEGRCDPGLEVVGDRQLLSQMLVNLCTNACDASERGGRVEVLAAAEGERVRIEVRDRGRGIAPEIQPMVFEPFFTTKPAGEGTGLGLAMVYRVVQEHQGTIEIDSVPGRGTRLVVDLPRGARTTAAPAPRRQAGS